MVFTRALPAALVAALLTVSSFSPALAHPHPELLETSLMPYSFWTEPMVDDIYHVPTGLKLSFEGMVDMMEGSRVIYVGENHDNIHAHRIQLAILRELVKRHPGRVAVGMEMFREDQQENLDLWTQGRLSELEFLRDTDWFKNWRFNYTYYRDIMNFIRDNRIDVVALNPPEDLQRMVGMGEDLTPEQEVQVPDTDSSDPHQRALVEAIYGAHEGGGRMQEAFLRVQLLWEENMAEQIVDYLDGPRGRDKIMVAITGVAHVKYGFGVPKKVVRRMPSPYHIVLPAIISVVQETVESQQIYMDVKMPEIPLLTGDFIWTVPYERLPDDKVLIGIQLNFGEGRGAIEKVADDSAAERAGVLTGDILVRLDGHVIRTMEDVTLIMRSKTVGDSIDIEILRDGVEMAFTARFDKPADHPS